MGIVMDRVPTRRSSTGHALARVFLAIGLVVSVCANAASPDVARSASGMVVSRSLLASEVGADIMKQGGNAIDAAVATAFALAVTYPSAGNIGGGGFMVIRLADGTVTVNDHRETAPARAHRDMYLDANENVDRRLARASHQAAGVPGSVAGLLDALANYGVLDRRRVMAPAIGLARDGFSLPADVAGQIAGRKQSLARFPGGAHFYKPDGTPYTAGEVLKQKDLAVTLERIAADGAKGFYEGKTADLIVQEMKRGNGLISHDDLSSYQSVWRQPVVGRYPRLRCVLDAATFVGWDIARANAQYARAVRDARARLRQRRCHAPHDRSRTPGVCGQSHAFGRLRLL